MAGPLLELSNVSRFYRVSAEAVAAVKNVSLTIEAGEMVAIVGPSGSGKSTLMNIMGCLDRATEGVYRVAERDTASLDADELAELRREHFGFVFQRYHLIGELTAQANVELPAVYAGSSRRERQDRARGLLTRLGLGERLQHRPSQLSGGQQQRVSIARALMNGGRVVLADEPTGALDHRSGAELIELLEALNAEGHTVIVVTHNPSVAQSARRIIEMRDGEIVADRSHGGSPHRPFAEVSPPSPPAARAGPASRLSRLGEALRSAASAMSAHPTRSFLTMLGIIVGIASVASVVALGEGSKAVILRQINAIGTNTVDIFPGSDFGDANASAIHTLTVADADALATLGFVDSVTPDVSANVTLRYRDVSAPAKVNGVGDKYFRVHDLEMAEGQPFDQAAARRLGQEVVIDAATRRRLFGDGGDAIGKVILVGSAPCRVVGVAARKDSPLGGSSALNVYAPYTTVLSRLLGQAYLQGITVRLADGAPPDAAAQTIVDLLAARHGRRDAFASTSYSIRRTVESATETLTALIASVALISLFVGGIGVMNIMLVSVGERTGEIGIRTAVGARRGDIMSQFLIESSLLCLTGGVLGVALSMLMAFVVNQTVGDAFNVEISPLSVGAAFAVSLLVGMVFGYMPARRAARLDPVEALARE